MSASEHTRTGAWLPGGRTLADLAGERCLVRPSRAPEMPLIQFRVVEVSPSKEYVRVEGSARHEWLCARDYKVIEVLEPWADNGRALAQLHGLLGTADVRGIAALLGTLRQFVPAHIRDSIEQTCPKLKGKPDRVNAELRTGAETENDAAADRLKAELRKSAGVEAMIDKLYGEAGEGNLRESLREEGVTTVAHAYVKGFRHALSELRVRMMEAVPPKEGTTP